MNKPVLSTLLALTLVGGATTAAIADTRYAGISGSSTRPVAGAEDTSYVLRTSYIVPGSWKPAAAKRGATTRRFGPVGSCRIKITITARPVADVAEPAAARVTRLLPATQRYVHDEGTRGPAAWRVIRATGSKTITGILTRPAPSMRTQPAGKRAWLELKAVGRVDPKVECHAGGPRTIAAQFGTMLAGGALGGFQPR